jgi:hypothetical protein
MTDITRKYTQDDFNTMGIRTGTLLEFVKLLDYNGLPEKDIDKNILFFIALIIKELIAPVEDFLSWAYTYAEIPEEEPEQTA